MNLSDEDIERVRQAVQGALNPLTVYDAATDQHRSVTQADVDFWQACLQALGVMRQANQRAAEIFDVAMKIYKEAK